MVDDTEPTTILREWRRDAVADFKRNVFVTKSQEKLVERVFEAGVAALASAIGQDLGREAINKELELLEIIQKSH